MKLPQALSMGVRPIQAEGTQDINNVLRVQQAQNQALHAAGSAAIAWQRSREESKLSEVVDESLREYAEMQTTLSQAGAVDLADDELVPSELRDEIMEGREGDLDSLKDEDGAAHVPAFEVRGKIHDHYLDKIMEEGREALGSSRRLQDRFIKAMSSPTINGANAILKKNMQEERAALSSKAELLYENAVRTGNLDQAVDIISSASETGIWSIEKANETLGKVEGDIEFSDALRVILSGNVDDIMSMQAGLSDDVTMTLEQKSALDRKADAKIKKQEDEHEESTRAASETLLIEAMTEINFDGAYSEVEIRSLTKNMRYEEAKLLLGANKVAREKRAAKVDNQYELADISLNIVRLANPGETPRAERKKDIREKIEYAMETGRLKPETALSLLGKMNNSVEVLLDDPQFKVKLKQGRDLISKASKSTFGLPVNAEAAAGAALFESAFTQAYLDTGPGFNANEWFRNNLNRFKHENVDKTIKKVESFLYDSLVIREGSPEIINIEKSKEKIFEWLDNQKGDTQYERDKFNAEASQLINRMNLDYEERMQEIREINERN